MRGWEGKDILAKGKKKTKNTGKQILNLWAPLKTNLHANTVCVPPKTESNSKIVASF